MQNKSTASVVVWYNCIGHVRGTNSHPVYRAWIGEQGSSEGETLAYGVSVNHLLFKVRQTYPNAICRNVSPEQGEWSERRMNEYDASLKR